MSNASEAAPSHEGSASNFPAAPIKRWAVHKRLTISDIFDTEDLPREERFGTKEEAHRFRQRIVCETREDHAGTLKPVMKKDRNGVPATKDSEGWCQSVPVVGRAHLGQRYSGPWLSDFLKPSEVTISDFDIGIAVDRVLDGREPMATCCLDASEWPWEQIERMIKRSVAYNPEEGDVGSLESSIIDVVHMLEACLTRLCQDLTADDLANFWESLEVERLLSEFCGKILAKNQGAVKLAGVSPRQGIYEVLGLVRRRIYTYAHHIREQLPFPYQQEKTAVSSGGAAPSEGEASAAPDKGTSKGAGSGSEWNTKVVTRARGPVADNEGHIRVAQILADHPNWSADLKTTCASLANPSDGKTAPDISQIWRKEYDITGYAGAFEAVGDKEIRQHLQRRIAIGNRLLAENSRKLSETVGGPQ